MTIYHIREKIELIRNILQRNGGEEQTKKVDDNRDSCCHPLWDF